MKAFNELSKQELANLSEIQVSAYIDIACAEANVVKPVSVDVDYPEYVKPVGTMPEMDVVVYEVDGYNFSNIEDAQKFAAFVGGLQQVQTSYQYYSVGDNVYFVTGSRQTVPTVQIKKMYSEAKFQACKAKIDHIRNVEKSAKKDNEEKIENAIDYDAIEQINIEIKSKVREAINFFAKAKSIASEYAKYFAITNDSSKAFEVLYKVYNLQDEEMKTEISRLVQEDISKVV